MQMHGNVAMVTPLSKEIYITATLAEILLERYL